MIAFSGTAVAFAEDAPQRAVTVSASSGVSAEAKAEKKEQAAAKRVASDLAEGRYQHVAEKLRLTQPQLRGLSDADLIALVERRANEILAEKRSGTKQAGGPGISGAGSGNPGGAGPSAPPSGGGVLTFDGPTDSVERPTGDLDPGGWRNPVDVPPMGTGYRTDISSQLIEERELNLARARLRSIFGGYADYSNLSFADVVADVTGGGIWNPLGLPSNTIDFDGDGELFDPLPTRPTVVYYQFLEENMTDLEWDDGEDLLNQVRLTTQDENMDMVIDIGDAPEDTDGIADNWPTNPVFVNRSVIPPPDPADFDEDLAIWLPLSGLGFTRWGDARPIFLHPDAEAAWRLAQMLYFAGDFNSFQESWDSGQVLEVEERQLVLAAMRAIEDVTNITFIERSDYPGQVPPGGVPFLPNSGVGYPLNAVGYPLDTSGQFVVDTGGISGIPGNSEVPWQPEDDHPWILIVKGSNPVLAEDGPSGSTVVGINRNIPAAPSIDYVLTDIDGDGFPDTPDTNFDGLPDQLVFSTLNGGNLAADNTSRALLDTNGDGQVTVLDSDLVSGGTVLLDDQAGFPDNFLLDLNFDLVPDSIVDTNGDGDPAVVDFFADVFLDFEGDAVADSAFPGGTAPSPSPFPLDSVPCEQLGLTQLTFDNQDVGGVVYQLMRHLGFENEHQRPDREDFIRVNYGNIAANQVGGFGPIQSGADKYANFIEDFDTTTSTVPPAGFLPRLPGLWTIAGAPTSGGWGFATPAPGDGVAPIADFAVDENDNSMEALVTGSAVGTQLVGETQFISPNIYGPEDGFVRFAYYINSTTTDQLDAGDGLIVQSSADGGVTWSSLIGFGSPSDEWREAEVVIGETRDDGATGLPLFQVRFIARNSDPSRVVEMAIDRIRVQSPYDFLSVMHFGEFAASIFPGEEGFETIEVRPPNTNEFQPVIGLAAGLSIGDRVGLSNLYGDPVVPDGGEPAPDPCRADVNGDGTISAVDVALFLELFNAGDPRADFADPEGVIDVLDLVQFFNDVQQSFRCINDPDNSFGFNNLTDLSPPG